MIATIRVGTPLPDRILYRSEPGANGCLVWTAFLDRDGYGWLSVDGRLVAAHRASYAAFVGPIPEGMTVDHTCFVPACVNADHLRLLTWEENRRNQRTALATRCQRGHEFTPENTGRHGPRQQRFCRTCRRIAQNRRRAAARAAA